MTLRHPRKLLSLSRTFEGFPEKPRIHTFLSQPDRPCQPRMEGMAVPPVKDIVLASFTRTEEGDLDYSYLVNVGILPFLLSCELLVIHLADRGGEPREESTCLNIKKRHLFGAESQEGKGRPSEAKMVRPKEHVLEHLETEPRVFIYISAGLRNMRLYANPTGFCTFIIVFLRTS